MSTDLITQEKSLAPMDPMQMIQLAFNKAIEQGSAMDVVNKILEQQRWVIQHREEEEFNAALRRIQDELKAIPKRGENKETHSMYATATDVDAAIQSLIKKERMTLSFVPRPSEKPEMVLIVGILSLGAYSKEYPLEMPADGKGAKGGGVMSRTHATGSAITYGKRYLKNMIFDLTFKEKDDDGNAAGHETLGDEEFIALKDNIENARNPTELTRFYLAAIKAAGLIGDKDAIEKFDKMANQRKGEFK
jgi:hypothetical protein